MDLTMTIDRFSYDPQETATLYKWFAAAILPFIQVKVLEVNSGDGDLSALLVAQGVPIHLNVPDEDSRTLLRERFKGITLVRGVHRINFAHSDIEYAYKDTEGLFATVIDLWGPDLGSQKEQVRAKAWRLLKDGGIYISAVPSHSTLWPGIHYSPEELRNMEWLSLKRRLPGFDLLTDYYFELVGEATTASRRLPGLYILLIARKNGASSFPF